MRHGKVRSDRPRQQGRAGKGYRLHDRRLAFSRERLGERGSAVFAIRTIKFPLSSNDAKLPIEKLANSCKADALSVYGPLNFSDWYHQYTGRAPYSYNLLDFWIDALASGGVFQSAKNELRALAQEIRGDDPKRRVAALLRPVMRQPLRDVIRFDDLYWFLFKNQRPTGSATGKIARLFEASVVKESPEVINAVARDYQAIAGRLKELTPQQGFHAKLSLFADVTPEFSSGVRKAGRVSDEESKVNDKGLGLTYLILPQLPAQELPKVDELIRVSRGSRVNQILSSWETHRSLFRGSFKEETLMGLDSSFNALANFGGGFLSALRASDGAERVFAAMAECLEWGPAEAEIVQRRIRELRERALWLPEQPRLTAAYSEYRTDLGGKLSSWLSNRENYAISIREALKEATTNLRVRRERVASVSDTDERGPIEMLELIDQASVLVGRLAARDSSSELFSPESKHLYEQLNRVLSVLEPKWNEWLQKQSGDDTEFSGKARKRRAGEKAIRLPKFPSFFGDERRATYVRMLEAPALVERLGLKLAALFQADDGFSLMDLSEEQIGEIAQRLLFAVWRVRGGGTPSVLKRRWASQVEELFFRIRAPQGYYKSKYARKRVDLLPAPSLDSLSLAMADLGRFAAEVFTTWAEYLSDRRGLQTLRSASQLAATLLSVRCLSPLSAKPVLQTLEQISGMKLKVDGAAAFPSVASLFDVYQMPDERLRQLDRALSRTMSEFTGLVGLLSRQRIQERYSVQAINGEQTDVYCDRAGDPQKAKFAVGFPRWREVPEPPLTSEYPELFIRGNAIARESKRRVKTGAHFRIQTSKYQVQFLRWALKRPKSKRCELSPGGSFLIAEYLTRIVVTREGLRVEKDSEAPRCFVSMPFTMMPLPEDSRRPGRTAENRDLPTHGCDPDLLLGVDVGEYALAYCVVKRSKGADGTIHLETIASGVLSDGTHRALRDKVARLERRQRLGGFASLESSVAGARETLIGSYTNKLHHLMLRHRARLVFEWNISAFEAGGNRIKVICNTVKLADCVSGERTEADDARRKHVWGVKRPESGMEVTAQGTSQTCACCRRWYRVFVDGSSDQEIRSALSGVVSKADEGHYTHHEIRLRGARLAFFLPPAKRYLARSLNEDALKSAIKAYLRPPLWRLGKGVLPKGAKRRRGNSAVFRCPFLDCGHIADADVQASFNIAARAFVIGRADGGFNNKWVSNYQQAITAPPGLERRYFGIR